jgi:pilus assembly protein CpaB
MLIVALLFGGLAVFIAKAWLANQQGQVVQQQAAPPPVKLDTQKVVVASKDLNFGEPITPSVVAEVDWPKDTMPQGAFTTIADLTKDGARAVLTPIDANEPILARKITGPGSRPSLSALVKQGMRAVTIHVNDTSGVAGFVLPGDRVDVLYTQGSGGVSSIDVLFQNVPVLAINQVVDEKTGNPIDGRTATLELSPSDAQKLALAQSTGDLTFTLRSAGSQDAAPGERVVQTELGSTAKLVAAPQTDLERRLAELEAKLKQEQAGNAQQVVTEAKAEEALPSTAQVTIFRGLESSSYTVPLDANK